jgi:tRNA (adenine37-N6)-methyltransferase
MDIILTPVDCVYSVESLKLKVDGQRSTFNVQLSTFNLIPVAWVSNARADAIDDHWGEFISEITLADGLPDEALDGIEEFSHLDIVFFMHGVDERDVIHHGRPRGNPAWPDVGIFAQRKKDRPNRLGLVTVALLERRGRVLRVARCDAIDGTPVLDIKPVMREFLPDGEIRQPAWSTELMREYW